jgi:hypothetical protein
MTEPTVNELESLATQYRQLKELQRELSGLNNTSGGGSATITVQAGPVGIWLAAAISACGAAFVAGAIIVGAAWFSFGMSDISASITKLEQRDNIVDAKLNVIYQHAPQLKKDKPKE